MPPSPEPIALDQRDVSLAARWLFGAARLWVAGAMVMTVVMFGKCTVRLAERGGDFEGVGPFLEAVVWLVVAIGTYLVLGGAALLTRKWRRPPDAARGPATPAPRSR